MSFGKSVYYSPVFRAFKAIPRHESRERVRYYEAHEKEILELDFDEYFDLSYNYSECLFEIGAYAKYLAIADILLPTIMEENLIEYKGKDLLKTILYCKGESHFHLMQYEKANHVLRELLKIYPEYYDAKELLVKNERCTYPAYWRIAKAFAIGMFLLSAALIGLEVLIIRPLYENYAVSFEMSRTFIFAVGLLTLALAFIVHFFSARRKVIRFIRYCRRRRKAKNNIRARDEYGLF